ncbi:MAG: PAS domain S-box protein [Chloroflexi bacterium]|nr:PAS domain S-box protein [Chloroflexota bacterium]
MNRIYDFFLGTNETATTLQQIRTQLVNQNLFFFLIVGLVGTISSLFRAAESGWQPVMMIQIILSLVLLTTVVFRKRFTFHVRTAVLIGVFLLLGIVGLWSFGLAGIAILALAIFCLLAAILLGTRPAIIAIIVSLTFIVIAGIGAVTGAISYTFDANVYIISPAAWIFALMGLTMFAGFSVTWVSKTQAHLQKVLQQSETQYKTLFDKASDAIFISDLQGNLLDANQRACDQLGYSYEELRGMKLEDLLAPKYADSTQMRISKLFELERMVFETAHVHRNGRILPIELSATIIELRGKTAVLSTARDITDRQKMEVALRESETRYRGVVEGTEEDLRKHARQQATVAQLGQRALTSPPLFTLFDEAVVLIANTLEADYCRVLELLSNGETMLLRAGVGWQEGLVGARTVDTKLDSQAGFTLLANEPVVVADLATDTRFNGLPLLHDHGVVSGISTIIGEGERPFGILGVHTTQYHEFSEDDVNFLQAMANVLGTAVAQHRAKETLRKSEALLRESQQLAHIGSWELIYENNRLYWSDETYHMFDLKPRQFVTTTDAFWKNVHPEDRQFVDKAYSDSVKNKTAYNIVHRLLLKDGTVKHVNERCQTIYDDAGEPVRSIGTIQDITQQVQVETALKKRNEELTTLYKTAMAISADLNLDIVLKTVAAQFSQALQVRGCAISFWNKEQDTIEIAVDHSEVWPDKVDPPGTIYHLNNYPSTRRVLETRRPMSLQINDSHADPNEITLMKQLGFSNLLMLALVTHDQVWGLVELFEKDGERDYTLEEIRLAQSLASQAAIAIQNAGLHEEVQNYAAVQEQHIAKLRTRERHLQLLNSITHAALKTDSPNMLQLLAERMRELLAADSCYIMLWDEAQQKTILAASSDPLQNSFASMLAESDERTMISSVMHAGHPLIVEDTFNTPYLSPHIASLFPAHSLLGLPLIVGNQKLGATLIVFNQLHHITPDEIACGEQAAGQIALAIARAKLLEETQHHAAELEKRVAERTAELKQRVTEVEKLNSGMLNLLTDLRGANENVTRTAQQLEESNIELESFAYSVSHDLRAPLRHISGFVVLLQKRESGRLDEKSTQYLQVITEAAVRMGQLIDDLLVFSRTGRQALITKPVDVNKLVAEAQRELVSAIGNREIIWEIETLPTVTADPALLRQVWANLLENAIKYTIPRTQAHIKIGALSSTKDNEITFFVRDNGIGFDEKYIEKLFGVFQRLHRDKRFEGTGIGLATVRRIVYRHNGRTWAEGKVDKGATFYFTLPKDKRSL